MYLVLLKISLNFILVNANLFLCKSDQLPTIENGVIDESTKQVICRYGFTWQGGPDKAICNDSKRWVINGFCSCQRGSICEAHINAKHDIHKRSFGVRPIRCPVGIFPFQNGQLVATPTLRLSRRSAIIRCYEGYEVAGNPWALCKISALSWQLQGSCEPVMCLNSLKAIDVKKISGYVKPLLPSTQADGMIGELKCFDGFNLTGDPLVSCSSIDGLWRVDATCSVLHSSTPIPSINPQPTFTTLPPFSIYPSATDENTISPSVEGCKDSFPEILNGRIELSLADPQSKTYVIDCAETYSVIGSKDVICDMSTKQWVVDGRCVKDILPCGDFPEVQNGIIEPTALVDVAQINCDAGYRATGNPKVKCAKGRGQWVVQTQCKPIPSNPCRSLTLPDVSSVAVVKVANNGDYATQSCRIGFHLVGSDKIECNTEMHEWVLQGNCEKIKDLCESSDECVKCQASPLPRIKDGAVKLGKRSSHAQLICNQGYVRKGSKYIYCLKNGQWRNPVGSSCVNAVDIYGDCLKKTQISNGFIKPRTPKTAGEIVQGTIFCNRGFKLTKSRSKSSSNLAVCGDIERVWKVGATCVAEGATSAFQQRSAVTQCPSQPVEVQHGRISDNKLICNQGFQVRGSNQVSCNFSTSSWSLFGRCVPLHRSGDANSLCNKSKLPRIENGNLTSNFQIRCDQGFKLEGSGLVQCDLNSGGWQVSGKCTKAVNQCNELNLPKVENADVVLGKGKLRGIVTCHEGFFLKGEKFISCLQSGVWEIPATDSCISIYDIFGKCMKEFRLENGFISPIVPHSSTAKVINGSISCNKGFRLAGRNSPFCNVSSQIWQIIGRCVADSGISMQIEPNPMFREKSSRNCPRRIEIVNGQAGSDMKITCKPGYELVGDGKVFCNEQTQQWEILGRCRINKITVPF